MKIGMSIFLVIIGIVLIFSIIKLVKTITAKTTNQMLLTKSRKAEYIKRISFWNSK